MISFSEARVILSTSTRPSGMDEVTLLHATGRLLAADLTADRDFPPYDRVTMDGIALNSAAFHEGVRSFPVAGIQPAGQPQQRLNNPKSCLEVMTGAVLPAGCDAVVPYEDCTIEHSIARLAVANVLPGQNIHPKGSDERAGQILVKKGAKITPAIIGIAATIGLGHIPVLRLPRVAVCSTGDELVAIHETPNEYQIRRSNNHMLDAALREEGITPEHYHLPDAPGVMKEILASLIVSYDVLLFSGAVSKGKFDFLPVVLNDLGMETLFHRVAQKPGKPMLFGRFPAGAHVFGFPGNPVSTLVCFHVFFKWWLDACLGNPRSAVAALLDTNFTFRPALDYHLPVSVQVMDGCLHATPNPGGNSGDMVSLSKSTAVITLPADRHDFVAGEIFPLTWLQHPEAGESTA